MLRVHFRAREREIGMTSHRDLSSKSSLVTTFEPLEPRQLMAANAGVSGSVLRVDGTDAADRILIEAVTVTIQQSNPSRQLGGSTAPAVQRDVFHVKVTDSAGNVRSAADGSALDKTFYRAGITRIDVFAGAGNDYVDATTTSVKNKFHLGAGNDEAVAGGADDLIYGESGNDEIWARGGNDKVFCGDGADYASGSTGNDRLFGGAGTDLLSGDAGDDWLEAGSASEIAYGGTGTNFNAHEWSVNGTDRGDVKQGRAHSCSLMST